MNLHQQSMVMFRYFSRQAGDEFSDEELEIVTKFLKLQNMGFEVTPSELEGLQKMVSMQDQLVVPN